MVRLPRLAVGLLFCSCTFAAAAPARAPNSAATGETGTAGAATPAPPPESVKPSKEEVRLYPIPSHGKYGYIDRSGKVVIEPQFIGAGDFHEGRAWVKAAGADAAAAGEPRYGYIDATGKIVIAPQFLFASDFSDGVAFAILKDDPPPPPVRISPSSDFVDLKRVLIDVTGKQLAKASGGAERKGWVPSAYLRFSEGLARVSDTDIVYSAASVRAPAGKSRTVLEQSMTDSYYDPANEGTSWGGADRRQGWDGWGLWGFLDKKGKVTIPPQFSQEREFHEGLAAVRVPSKSPVPTGKTEPGFWGFIDTAGKMVIEPQFEDAGDFSEGVAIVKLADIKGGIHYWVVIERSGKTVLKIEYIGKKRPGKFCDGLAPVPGEFGDENSRRYIDKTGKRLSIYDPTGMRLDYPNLLSAPNFSGGLARITWRSARSGDSRGSAGGVAYIDTAGKFVWHE